MSSTLNVYAQLAAPTDNVSLLRSTAVVVAPLRWFPLGKQVRGDLSIVHVASAEAMLLLQDRISAGM